MVETELVKLETSSTLTLLLTVLQLGKKFTYLTKISGAIQWFGVPKHGVTMMLPWQGHREQNGPVQLRELRTMS